MHHVPERLRNKHGKSHTVSSSFDHRTTVMFPSIYTTNMESPTLLVVDSTVVRPSHSQKFMIVTPALAHVASCDFYCMWRVDYGEQR